MERAQVWEQHGMLTCANFFVAVCGPSAIAIALKRDLALTLHSNLNPYKKTSMPNSRWSTPAVDAKVLNLTAVTQAEWDAVISNLQSYPPSIEEAQDICFDNWETITGVIGVYNACSLCVGDGPSSFRFCCCMSISLCLSPSSLHML